MKLLRVLKRDLSAVNNTIDFNPSVFRYFLEGDEIKHLYVRSGLKSAFLGMLDSAILNDSKLSGELSNWVFTDPVQATLSVGGPTITTNLYVGIQYIYRQAITTITAAAAAATLGTYTGLTHTNNPAAGMMGGNPWPLEPNLNLATHGNDNGTFRLLTFFGGTQPITEVSQTTPAGFYAVVLGETATHGNNNGDFEPLVFWNQSVTPPLLGTGEFTGNLTELRSGYTLDSKKIGLALTTDGEALQRYNPIDLVTFAALVKLQYSYRLTASSEMEI